MNPIQLFSFSPGSTPEQQMILLLHSVKADQSVVISDSKKGAKRFSKTSASAEPLIGENERTRDESGKFLADDPSTEDVDEAWTKVCREN